MCAVLTPGEAGTSETSGAVTSASPMNFVSTLMSLLPQFCQSPCLQSVMSFAPIPAQAQDVEVPDAGRRC